MDWGEPRRRQPHPGSGQGDDSTGVPSRVEWTLDDAPGGTRVVVEERPLVPLEVAGIPLHWRPRATGTLALARAAALALA